LPNFNRGTEVAEAQSKAAGGQRASFLSIKSGERKILRPLTDLDAIITIDVHMGVPTKPHPKNVKEDNWPGQMSAVCQNAPAFIDHYEGGGDNPQEGEPVYEEGYGHCYIHEHMQNVMGRFKVSVAVPKTQIWGLFVLREAIYDNGKITGFKDVLEDFTDSDGKTHKIPKIVIASQSWSNFWAQFAASAFMTDTICDKDFGIERVDNDYTVSPGPATPDLKPGTPAWQRYTDALALRDLSVEGVITYQSSPDYYGRFFDPEWKDPSEDEEGGTAAASGNGTAADATAGETVLDDAEADRMRTEMAKAFSGTEPT
jgi:hypothetical protein